MHIMVAIIGTLFAAPLRLSVNGVPFVEGRKGSGKTLIAFVTLTLMSDALMDARSIPINFTRSSRAGVQRQHELVPLLLVVGDDYRREGVSDYQMRRSTDAVEAHVQAGYGAAEEAKSTASRELGAVSTTAANAMVTGEVGPSAEAISSRTILLHVGPETVSTQGPGNAYDTYKATYSGGPGSELFTLFLSRLCGLMDAHDDGMPGVLAEAETYRSTWAREHSAHRASETVSSAATGWHYLRVLAREHGAEDLLPTEAEVDVHLDTLVQGNLVEAEEIDVGRRLLQAIGTAISDGDAHLLDIDKDHPYDYPRWGWTLRSIDNDYREESGPSFIPRGFRAGYISGGRDTPDEDRRIVITKSAVQQVWKTVFNTYTVPTDRELSRALSDHVVKQPGATSVFPRSSFPGHFNRQRGAVFTLEALGLSDESEVGLTDDSADTSSETELMGLSPEEYDEF